MIPEDSNESKEILIDINSEIKSLVEHKTRLKKTMTPDKFMDLVSKEFGCIRKYNRILRKIEKYLGSDEFIFSLDPKDLISLMNSVTKSKYASLSFLTRLYDISTKNEIIRAYFQDNPTHRSANIQQNARIREVVNEMKKRAREANDISSED